MLADLERVAGVGQQIRCDFSVCGVTIGGLRGCHGRKFRLCGRFSEDEASEYAGKYSVLVASFRGYRIFASTGKLPGYPIFTVDTRGAAATVAFIALVFENPMTIGDSSAQESLANSNAIEPTPPTESAPSESTSSEASTPESGALEAVTAKSETSDAAPKISSGPLAARGLGMAKPASPQAVSTEAIAKAAAKAAKGHAPKGQGGKGKSHPLPRLAGESNDDTEKPQNATATATKSFQKVAVPNLRMGLSDDLQAELDAELAAMDVAMVLSGNAGMPDRREPLSEGARVHALILKIHEDSVFVSLGGPDEGVVPFVQFTGEEPVVGQSVEVMIRGFNRDDGLFVATLPGQAVDVSDWTDIDEGTVVEATITSSNTGGVECSVGNMKGFIPISQLSEHRVEDASEFVGQKMMCVVTECNERRGNLVLSHRAILEREREGKKKEQLEKFEPGDELEGTVRSVKDFGAFVDLGGLDGLIHVSKLSWERIKHPSEVLTEGQQVRVVIETIDKQTGKISLSYRDLLENPWDIAEATFGVGSMHRGAVTRIANFGAFVRLTAGVEGLVHISELAHHRVSKVDSVVQAGQEVEVKVLSFDRDAQKIGLSMKATLAKSEPSGKAEAEPEEEPIREPAVKATHDGPLKGGNNRDTGGERFGLRW